MSSQQSLHQRAQVKDCGMYALAYVQCTCGLSPGADEALYRRQGIKFSALPPAVKQTLCLNQTEDKLHCQRCQREPSGQKRQE